MSVMAERTQINLRVSEAFKAKLQAVADRRGVTVIDVIMTALAADPELKEAVISERFPTLGDIYRRS